MKKSCCCRCGEKGTVRVSLFEKESSVRSRRYLIEFKKEIFCFDCLNMDSEIEAVRQSWERAFNRPSSPVSFEDDNPRDGNRMIPRLHNGMSFKRYQIPYLPKETNNA